MTTELIDNRREALRVGYLANDWNNPIQYSDYIDALKDVEVKAVARDGKVIGAIYQKGPEVHASILPAWRGKWATKGLLRQLLPKGATTRISAGHDQMYGIMSRLGFVDSGDGLLVKEI